MLQMPHECHLPNLGMNWLESLGLTSIHLPSLQVSLFLHQSDRGTESEEEGTVFKSQHKWDKKNSVPSPLRSRIFIQNWIVQLPKILKFGNCSIQHTLQMAFTNALQAAQSGAGNKSGNNSLSKVNHFWASPGNPSFLLGRMGALT